jgi:SMC interacting uncharacterized protein involved in chromosome segregation
MGKQEDLAVLIAKVDESVKSAHKRLDKLEENNDAIYKLATNMEVMAETQKYQQKAIDKLNENLEVINSKPGKWVDLVKSTLISAFFGGIGATLVAILLK